MISAANLLFGVSAMKKTVAIKQEGKIADIPYIHNSVTDCKPYC